MTRPWLGTGKEYLSTSGWRRWATELNRQLDESDITLSMISSEVFEETPTPSDGGYPAKVLELEFVPVEGSVRVFFNGQRWSAFNEDYALDGRILTVKNTAILTRGGIVKRGELLVDYRRTL